MSYSQGIKASAGKYCGYGERNRYTCKTERRFLQTRIGRLAGIVWNELLESLGGGGRKSQYVFSRGGLRSLG